MVGVTGSIPVVPTSLRSLRELRLGKPDSTLKRAKRAKAAAPKPLDAPKSVFGRRRLAKAGWTSKSRSPPPPSAILHAGSKRDRENNMPKGSDLLVAALENEGVDRIFGVPGEENLDVVESLRSSSIELVLTRHEQGAAFMAATYGRLTGKPGVCITTLGPGRAEPDDRRGLRPLGAMPMVMITGQKGIMTQPAGRASRSSTWSRLQAADQDGAPDRQRRHASRRWCAMPSASPGGAARPGAAGTAGGHRRRGGRSRSRWCRRTRSTFPSRTARRWTAPPR